MFGLLYTCRGNLCGHTFAASKNTKRLISGQQLLDDKPENNIWRQHALPPDVVLENFQAALAFEGGVGLLDRHLVVPFEPAIVEI